MSESEERPMNESEDRTLDQRSHELPAELKALEARLAALAPRDDRLDRERLMFLAGRASVEGPIEADNPSPRVWLKTNAWPAAFTGMTAIAASLLVALVARPVVSEPTFVQVASDANVGSLNRPFVERDLSLTGSVLSPSDARRGDIETLVASAPLVASVDAPNSPRNEQDSATLTPAAWRQLIEAADVPRPDSNDSSEIRMPQGATS
ncbi:MAG TPA: hypothetical protein VHK01_10395 [Lacipirellulaceae bacterium]|jgi:hypothetical protein|nr:hypothetical protein [Lacipirellulaceae bacterium]